MELRSPTAILARLGEHLRENTRTNKSLGLNLRFKPWAYYSKDAFAVT